MISWGWDISLSLSQSSCRVQAAAFQVTTFLRQALASGSTYLLKVPFSFIYNLLSLLFWAATSPPGSCLQRLGALSRLFLRFLPTPVRDLRDWCWRATLCSAHAGTIFSAVSPHPWGRTEHFWQCRARLEGEFRTGIHLFSALLKIHHLLPPENLFQMVGRHLGEGGVESGCSTCSSLEQIRWSRMLRWGKSRAKGSGEEPPSLLSA